MTLGTCVLASLRLQRPHQTGGTTGIVPGKCDVGFVAPVHLYGSSHPATSTEVRAKNCWPL